MFAGTIHTSIRKAFRMTSLRLILTTLALGLLPTCAFADADLAEQAEASLQRSVAFFYSINTQGGYVYHVTPDLSRRWGENPVDTDTIEVQPPGTPAVGMSFLAAYRATADPLALQAALDAGKALLRGQNSLGGWEHTINFARAPRERVSLDDDQTQSAIRFLIALGKVVDNGKINDGIQKALKLMMEAQLDNGGWPHVYPKQGNYHDYATFNDGGINDCIQVMIEAYDAYGSDEIKQSLRKAARFLNISQLPPPQPGWAQQYNEYLQPAWARSFEPPAVCPLVTVKNLDTLIDLYLVLGDKTYLEPIPDSLRWLASCRLDNGKWARFVEIGTGKPLYYDRGRIRVDSLDQLHIERSSGYGYQTDLQKPLAAVQERFRLASQLSRRELAQAENELLSAEAARARVAALTKPVETIIASQQANGAWVTHNDRFKKDMPRNIRWNGQYEQADRISSAVFNRNVKILSEYLESFKRSMQN